MPSKELYIGNLDKDTKQQEITEIFQLYGTINRCEVKFGGLTHSAAYGFIGFESSDDAERAQRQENGRSLRGRRLIVQFTKTKAGQNTRRDRSIGLQRMENRNSNERDRSRSRDRHRRRRSPSYSRRSARDQSSSRDHRRKRDRSRSSSNYKSSSKRLHLSSNDDKPRTSHSHKNGNSKKH